jgi:hypothetical protein
MRTKNMLMQHVPSFEDGAAEIIAVTNSLTDESRDDIIALLVALHQTELEKYVQQARLDELENLWAEVRDDAYPVQEVNQPNREVVAVRLSDIHRDVVRRLARLGKPAEPGH